MIEVPAYAWWQWIGILLISLSAGYLAMFGAKIIRLYLKVKQMKEVANGPMGERIRDEGIFEELEKELENLDMEPMMEELTEMQEAQDLEENLSERWDNE